MPPGEIQFPPRGHDDLLNSLHYPERPETEVIDQSWIVAEIPQIAAVRGMVTDDSAESVAAQLVTDIMIEFAGEGLDFQPSDDDELVVFIKQYLHSEVPDLSADQADDLIDQIGDFSPGIDIEMRLARQQAAGRHLGRQATKSELATAA